MQKHFAKYIALAVQLLLLACALASPVNAKTALGPSVLDYQVALGTAVSKSLSVLDNFLAYKVRALGCCVGANSTPDTNPDISSPNGGGTQVTSGNNNGRPAVNDGADVSDAGDNVVQLPNTNQTVDANGNSLPATGTGGGSLPGNTTIVSNGSSSGGGTGGSGTGSATSNVDGGRASGSTGVGGSSGGGSLDGVDFTTSGSGNDLRRFTTLDGENITFKSGHAYHRTHAGGDVSTIGTMDQIENAILQDISTNSRLGSLQSRTTQTHN